MSIQFAKSYRDSNGICHATIEEAQVAELTAIMDEAGTGPSTSETVAKFGEVAKLVVASKDKVLDVLTLTDSSRPKGRKINGGTKKRKTSAAAPEQSQLAAELRLP